MTQVKIFLGGILAAMLAFGAWLLSRRRPEDKTEAEVADELERLIKDAADRKVQAEREAAEELARKLAAIDQELAHAVDDPNGSLAIYIREQNRRARERTKTN